MKKEKYLKELLHRISWSEIDEKYILSIIEIARSEDMCGLGLKKIPQIQDDITTKTLTPNIKTTCVLSSRNDIVLCGINLVEMILSVYAKYNNDNYFSFNAFAKDGDAIQKNTKLAEITGSASTILQSERIILNFIQRLSGISTLTKKYVDAMGVSNAKLLDTRKTTPCFRMLEKYAVACGGAYNHRFGLFDRVMLKDNHLAFSSSVSSQKLADAVLTAKEKNPNYIVEVEVDDLDQIPYVLDAEADVIMFDNFSIEELHEAIDIVGGRAWTEVSGNVNLDTLPQLAKLNVDFISSGALIHKSQWVDIGLDSV